MKKIRVKRPLIVFSAGILLLAASSIGATRAVPVYQAAAQEVDFSTSKLKVDVLELQNDEYVSISDNLTFPEMLISDGVYDVQIGKRYPESVVIKNTSPGGYDEYVRVNVRKTWKTYNELEEEITDTSLNPNETIDLEIAPGWIVTEENDEGAIYYYQKPLTFNEDGKSEAVPFIESVTIDNKVWDYVKTEGVNEDGTIIQNVYQYNNHFMTVELKVDAVQAHNGADAMLGAWGVQAQFDENKNLTSVNGYSDITK